MLPGKQARAKSGATSRDKQKATTRRRIYEAAKDLFHEKGYLRTRTSDIAERAGVSQGAVHAHFQSKANILSVLMVEYFDRVDEAVRSAALLSTDPVERLKEAILHLVNVHLANGDQVSWYFGYSWIWEETEERTYRSHQDRIDGKLCGILEDGVAQGRLRPETPVAMIADVIRGYYMTQLRRLRFEPEPPDEVARRIGACVELLLGPFRV
jgi:AcrR family transcriptional regulator